jgi:RNA polymerase sigma-70 factor (ECF subfamily)
MFDEHIHFVAGRLRKAGVPRSDLDDEVQRTFIVAARRLDDVKHGAERAFLLKVAVNVALHARRRFARRREVLTGDEALERIDAGATPESLVERRQLRKLLDDVVDGMHESLRAVFRLYEFEEMTGNEIASLLGVPRGTVASRLRAARAQVREHVAVSELVWDGGAESIARPDVAERTRAAHERFAPRRQEMSALERALFGVATTLIATGATRAKIVAALGLSPSDSLTPRSW